MKRALLPLLLAVACRPDFGERESFVDRPEVLAVLLDPPEAKPGAMVTTSLVVASPDGPITTPLAAWAFCTTPKLLTENGAVSPACLGDGVIAIPGGGPSVVTALPTTSCSLFGPDVTSADLRPRDPDVTGGYFVPIRAEVGQPDGDVLEGFGFARVTCNLANAGADQVTRFAAQYQANRNPVLFPLTATVNGGPVSFDQIPRGANVALHASWAPANAETYAYFDPATSLVTTKRESMRVSWFATAGAFQEDRTGRTETELDAFTDNAWTAPDGAGVAHLWAVLRDSRGGTTATDIAITVR